jgi:hypothetical protein
MEERWDDLQNEMERALADLEMTGAETIPYCQSAIKIIKGFLEKLRTLLFNYEFDSVQKEVLFFKHVKPFFLSKLIFHCEVLSIESKRPPGNKEFNLGYYNGELARINRFFVEHLVLWQYHTLRNTSLDEIYFTRTADTGEVFCAPFTINQDKVFSTSHDFIFAKLMAYDTLSTFLNNTIKDVESDASLKQAKKDKMVWTGSKAALIELIYGLHSCGVINNGNVEVKQIAAFFEEHFNVNVGNWYRAFQDMRERKAQRTIFVDQLKKKLLDRMDETDNRTS